MKDGQWYKEGRGNIIKLQQHKILKFLEEEILNRPQEDQVYDSQSYLVRQNKKDSNKLLQYPLKLE